MSFKSFSSTLPTGKNSPAATDAKIAQTAPMQDQPAAPAGKAPAAVPANKA